MSEGRLVLDLVRQGRFYGLRTPAELTLLGKTLRNLEAVCLALDPTLDVEVVVGDHLDRVVRARLTKTLSPASIASEMMELHGLVREAPRRISDVLSLLAGNRLQMRVTGLEGPQLMQNLQTIANRISPGVIVAALIAASAMPMRHRCRAGDVRIPGRRARLLSDRQRHGPADGAGGADQRASRGTTRGSRPALKVQGCRGEAGTAHCRFTARAARLNRTPAHWAHPLITRIR